jgi:hypothetical protein
LIDPEDENATDADMIEPRIKASGVKKSLALLGVLLPS